MVADGDSCGGRKSSGAVNVCAWWKSDLPTTNVDSADSGAEGDEPARLSGGEAMADFKKPRAHKPPAAIRISRILRVLSFRVDSYIDQSLVARMSMVMRTALHTSHKDDHERDEEKGS